MSGDTKEIPEAEQTEILRGEILTKLGKAERGFTKQNPQPEKTGDVISDATAVLDFVNQLAHELPQLAEFQSLTTGREIDLTGGGCLILRRYGPPFTGESGFGVVRPDPRYSKEQPVTKDLIAQMVRGDDKDDRKAVQKLSQLTGGQVIEKIRAVVLNSRYDPHRLESPGMSSGF